MAARDESTGRFAVVIPLYNHEARIADVVASAKSLGYPVIVVDDGSTDASPSRIADIEGITLLRHEANMGKGAALKTGFREAATIADWAITIDADGQHDPEDAKSLIAAIPPGTRPIVLGVRQQMAGKDVPWTSRFGRGFSNFWVRMSGGGKVSDSQSGFRIYPLPEALCLGAVADRFQFEVEVLARAGWNRLPVVEAPVSVSYRPGTVRISHFRPFVDFLRNSSVFARLITARIFIPRMFRRRLLNPRIQ
ncbi:MAG: glycosyltransferase family 2 protein [Spirochaetes bacterium]|nr:glycosyltransferase family 2 protein [Spirochaetota bacterium]